MQELLPKRKLWQPEVGRRVITTLVDPPDYGFLTRLENVVKVEDDCAHTTSGRVFYLDTLLSTDACSLDYGRLRMEQASDEGVARYRLWQLQETADIELTGILTTEYLGSLNPGDKTILRHAVASVRARHAFLAEPDHSAVPVTWFYFKTIPPVWLPLDVSYLYMNTGKQLFAVNKDGHAALVVRSQSFDKWLKQRLIIASSVEKPDLRIYGNRN